MKYKGSELVFISQIKRDGSGVSKLTKGHIKVMEDDIFSLSCLSLSERTYIAINFNAYVVKLKSEK